MIYSSESLVFVFGVLLTVESRFLLLEGRLLSSDEVDLFFSFRPSEHSLAVLK